MIGKCSFCKREAELVQDNMYCSDCRVKSVAEVKRERVGKEAFNRSYDFEFRQGRFENLPSELSNFESELNWAFNELYKFRNDTLERIERLERKLYGYTEPKRVTAKKSKDEEDDG